MLYPNRLVKHAILTLAEHCQNGDLRLVGGRDEAEGRIELCYEEVYGSVCGNGFDLRAAAVVCRQLGYSSPLGMFHNQFYHSSQG